MSEPELIVDAKNRLGESAMWHPRERALYWIDARAPALYRLESERRRHHLPASGDGRRRGAAQIRRHRHRVAARLPRHRHGDRTTELHRRSRAGPARQPHQRRKLRPARPVLGRHPARHDPRAARLAIPARSGPQRPQDVPGHHRDQHGPLQPGRPHAVLRRHLQRRDVRVRLLARRRRDLEPPRVRRHQGPSRPSRRLGDRRRRLPVERGVRRLATWCATRRRARSTAPSNFR